MDSPKPNSYGLFDAPVRLPDKERITLTPEELERRRDAGAFALTRKDAIEQGFLSPHEEPDTVIVSVADAQEAV